MKRTFRNIWLAATATMLVTACGGGGSSGEGMASGSGDGPGGSTGSAPPPSPASTTVQVTGAIAGFGSVIVNGVRYDTESAQVSIDGQAATMADLKVGQVIDLTAEKSGSTVPRAVTIRQRHLIEGVVEAVDVTAGTLTIAGQTVVVDADTSIDDSIPQRSLAGVEVGDRIEVHGFIGADGTAQATRIELKNQPGNEDDEVEVTGTVGALDTAAHRFRIGQLVVDYSTAVLERFPASGPVNSDLVEVKGTSFLDDGALRATRVKLEDRRMQGNNGDEGEIEGLITRFASATDFDIAGRKVTTTSATVFRGGTADDLKLDVKVEAEGHLDASGTLVAEKIAFKRRSNARLEADVESIDAEDGTFMALGLTIVVDATTRREDHSGHDRTFGLDDLRVGDRVEVRGFTDQDGRIVAIRLEREDDGDDEVELRGLASNFEQDRFEVLGVPVEVQPGTQFEDDDDTITAGEFFDRADGRIVDVDGTWNGTALLAREAEIEDEDDADHDDDHSGRGGDDDGDDDNDGDDGDDDNSGPG